MDSKVIKIVSFYGIQVILFIIRTHTHTHTQSSAVKCSAPCQLMENIAAVCGQAHWYKLFIPLFTIISFTSLGRLEPVQYLFGSEAEPGADIPPPQTQFSL